MKRDRLDPGQVVLDVGGRIREIRVSRGFTQEQIADQLGMLTRTYQVIENGQNLTIKSLVRIANVLGVPLADLFTAPAPHEPRRGRPPKAK